MNYKTLDDFITRKIYIATEHDLYNIHPDDPKGLSDDFFFIRVIGGFS